MKIESLRNAFPNITNYRPIGHGSFSEVFIGEHSLTRSIVAMKVVPISKLDTPQKRIKIKREIDLMKRIDHPFIIHYYFCHQDSKCRYIMMEFSDNGNLLEYINKVGKIKEDTAKKIFCQLLSALRYLHEEMLILHRDIKMENVLLTTENNIRLIDFGLSAEISMAENLFSTFCGSMPYIAPEITKKEDYSTAVDIWSAGVILYCMVTGSLPFYSQNTHVLMKQIQESEPFFPSYLSPDLVDLLKGLLSKDKNSRLTAASAAVHPWISSTNYSYYTSDSFLLDSRFKVLPKDLSTIDDSVIKTISHYIDSPVSLLDNFITEENESTFLYRLIRSSIVSQLIERNTYYNEYSTSLPVLRAKKQSESYSYKRQSFNEQKISLADSDGIRKRVRMRRFSHMNQIRPSV